MEQAFSEPVADQQHGNMAGGSTITELNWLSMMLLPIPVWIFFGNLTVLVVIAENASLRRTWSNKIIFSLALTDMTISVVVMPFAAIGQLCNNYWPFGFGVCAFHVISDVYFCSSSIMHLMLIAVNRYAAIGWPISYRRVNMAVGLQAIFLSGVWCLPMLITAPLVIHIFFNPEGIYKDNHCAILFNSFILYGSISTFYLPLLIMIAVDIRSFFLLRSKNKANDRLKSIVIHVGIERKSNDAGQVGRKKRSVVEQLERLRHFLGQSSSSTTKQRPSTVSTREGTLLDPNGPTPLPAFNLENYSMKRNNSCPQTALELGNSTNSSKNGSPERNDAPKMNDQFSQEPRLSFIKLKQSASNVSTWSAIVMPVKNFFKRQRAETALLTVFIVFVICWMPFFTINVLQTIIPAVKQESNLFLIFEWLGYCSSGLNPIIYPVFNSEYRKCFMRTFGNSNSQQDRQSSVSMTRNGTNKTNTSDNKNDDVQLSEQDSTNPSATSPNGRVEIRQLSPEFPRITSQTMSVLAINTNCVPENQETNKAVLQVPINESLAALISPKSKRISLIDDDFDETTVITV